jgi:hypothetical protein
VPTSPSSWLSLGGSPSLVSETMAPGQRLLSVAPNLDGRLEVFGLGTDGGIWHLWQTGNGGWASAESWAPRGVPPGITFGGPDPERRIGPVAATNADGRLELFALGDDGAVWHHWQRAPNSGWAEPWVSRGRPEGVELLDLIVDQNADGRLEIFAVGDDGAVWQHYQTAPSNGWLAPGTWISRGHPPGIALESLSIGCNLDSRLEIFAAGEDGAVWHQWQSVPNGGWNPPGAWLSRGHPPDVELARPAVGRNADCRLEIFAVGTDGALWHHWQTEAGTSWNPPGAWRSRGIPPGAGGIVGAPVVRPNRDGRLEVFAWFANGTIQHTYQTQPNTGWLNAGTWMSLGADGFAPASDPAVGCNADGRLEALVVDNHVGDVYRACQRAPNGAWGG